MKKTYFLTIFFLLAIQTFAADNPVIYKILDAMKPPAVTNIRGVTYVKMIMTNDSFLSKETVLEKAEKNARLEIYGYYGGRASRMLFGSEMFDSLRLYQYVQSSVSIPMPGYITEFNALSNYFEPQTNELTAVTYYTEAVYEKIKGETDPRFFLSPVLSKYSYKPGDKLELSVSSEQDCYLTVFQIDENETCSQLFPEQDGKYLLKAGKEVFLPFETNNNKYILTIPPKTDEKLEILRFIATESVPDFKGIKRLNDFPKKFTGFARDELEYFDIGYKIIKQ